MTDGGYNTAVNSRADQLPTGRSCHVFLVFMEWRYTGQGGSGLPSLGPASEDGMRKFDAIPRVACTRYSKCQYAGHLGPMLASLLAVFNPKEDIGRKV